MELGNSSESSHNRAFLLGVHTQFLTFWMSIFCQSIGLKKTVSIPGNINTEEANPLHSER
jgi:hypothetical protein